MHVKTSCKHFTWKKSLLIDMNKINQNILREPHCDLNKLTKLLNCPKDCEYYMDGIRGEYTSINVSIKDATGNINNTDTITMDAETEITFSSVDANLESHIFKEDGTKNVYVYDKTITVPEGYKIDTVTGINDEQISSDGRTVTGETIANTDIEIKFVRSNGSPGFELILVVCAIALFLFWRQKRRN